MFKKTKVCTGLMVAFGGALSLAVGPALAQQTLEKVEITGSSIKRIDAETALPVQVITREQIEKTGATTVEQLLQTVTAISSSGGITAASVSGATTGSISSVSLRGLNSQHTLVLLNGRRIAPYGIGFTNDNVSVDVNSIPLSAIERVEILKDGASAVYGSDAIAGVINFILRKDFTGGEATGYYGDTADGGASVTRGSFTWGAGDLGTDRFNVMAVLSLQKEKPLFGAQRSFAQTAINPFNDQTSGNTFPANITSAGNAPAGSTFGSRNPSNPSCPGPYSVYDPGLSTRACRFDPQPLVQLVPTAERTSLFLSGRFAITPDIEAYAEASYNKNKQNNVIQPVPLSDQFTIPANNVLANQIPYNDAAPGSPGYNGKPGVFSTIVLHPGTTYYPTAYVTSLLGAGAALPDLLVRYRSAVTGNRNITDTSEAPRFVFGSKGTVAGWDFDANYLHSESKVVETVNNGYPALSAIMPILNSGNVNFFGPNTADVDAQLRATEFYGDAFKIKSTLDSLQAKVSKEVFQLPAGPAAIALGAEDRKEKYLFTASAPIQSGDISGYGGNFLPVDRNRNVEAVFGELNVPVFKGFEANAAVRWDHYGGVGSSTTPKLGLRYQPVKEVLFRASAGKGFRAPSLLDLYAPQTTGVTPAGENDPARCAKTGSSNDCATQFPILNGGNAHLKPEKSKNYTAGIVFEPTTNISVAVDWFSISMTDQINNGIPSAVILGDIVKYGSLITRGPASPSDVALGIPGPIVQIDQTNINVGKTNLSGIDFDFRARIPAGDIGRFTVQYTGTYFNRYDSQNLDGSFSPNINLVNSNSGGLIPRLKTYLSVNLATGPWSFTLAQNWQCGYEDLLGNLQDPAVDTPRQVGTYETYDGLVQYSGVKNLRISVGMKNMFNRAPPFVAVPPAVFQSGYDPEYADPRGRFVYASLTYSFK